MKTLGQQGEDLALNYLETKGFELIKRNYRHKRGEIDLIVKKSNLLCFVEVKLRSSDQFGLPETFVNDNQKRLIIETAEHFIDQNDWRNDIRFDIISIVNKGAQPELMHLEDAFY